MSFKKYLLAGGLSTVLLLGACGGEDNSTEESSEEEAVEENTEDESESSETEDSSEDIQTLEDENAELKAQNQQQQDQIVTLEEELETALETTEEVDIEESNVAEDSETEEPTSEQNADGESIKTYEGGESLSLDTIEMGVDGAVVFSAVANQDDEYLIMSQDVTAGDELDAIAIQYTVENTSDEPRTFYLDQADIVTSNGHQIESELLASEGLNSEMHGAVSNTGTVLYVLPDNSGEDIDWIDIIVPWVSDDDWASLTEEQKLRIEF